MKKIFGPSITRIIFYPGGANLLLIFLPAIFLLLSIYLNLKFLRDISLLAYFPCFLQLIALIIRQGHRAALIDETGVVIYRLFMPSIEIPWKFIEKIKTGEKGEGRFTGGRGSYVFFYKSEVYIYNKSGTIDILSVSMWSAEAKNEFLDLLFDKSEQYGFHFAGVEKSS